MARPKKYSKKELEEAIEKYFRSISALREARDKNGRVLQNADGEAIMVTEYAVPPTVSGLCLYLGIDRSTWQNYQDEEENPQLCGVIKKAKARIEAYLEEQLLLREKSVQGIIFNLQNNYGWRQKQEIEFGTETRKSVARNMSLSEKYEACRELAKTFKEDENGQKED